MEKSLENDPVKGYIARLSLFVYPKADAKVLVRPKLRSLWCCTLYRQVYLLSTEGVTKVLQKRN